MLGGVMKRRDFLLATAALMGQSFVPNALGAAETAGKLVYGLDKNDLGSRLGRLSSRLLYEVAPSYLYDLVNVSEDSTLRATNIVKRSVPDGGTLLQATGTIMSLYPCLYENLPYDPINDFVPVGFLGESTYMLVVGSVVPSSVKTVDDFIDWVFENPRYRNIGATLYGSEGHLAGLTLAHEKNIALSVQAYGGTSILVEDLLDGYIAAGFLATGEATQAIAARRLRVLGVTSAERHPPWPCVPTLAEQGVAGMDFKGWYGWLAPSNIPLKSLLKLSNAFEVMHKQPVFRTLQASLALNPIDLSPAEIQFRILKDMERCEHLYQKYGLSRIVV